MEIQAMEDYFIKKSNDCIHKECCIRYPDMCNLCIYN